MRLFTFLNQPTQSITLSALILGLSTLASALLGLLRDRLLASSFGASRLLDIYVASFRLPDLVYNFLVAGVLAVAILPVFAQSFQRDKEKAWRLVNNFFNLFLLALLFLCGLAFLLTPWLIDFIVPGFDQGAKQQAIQLTRLLFLSPIFFGGVGLFSGLLQYFNRFLILAISPLAYNLFIILSILFLSPQLGILGVGLGVVFGAFIYFCLQVAASFLCGFRWQAVLDWKDPGVGQVARLMLPRCLAAASQQINLLVTTSLASFLGSGAVAVFYFANNLQGFAVNFIGVSLATAAFQSLTKSLAGQDQSQFLKDFSSTFRKIFFLSLAFSLILFTFRQPVVALLLGSGRFNAEALTLTAAALGVFSLSILAQAEIPLLWRAFFARRSALKPTVISVLSVILNILLSFGLVSYLNNSIGAREFLGSLLGLSPSIGNFSLLALPLAFSLASFFQFFLLAFFLRPYLKSVPNHA